MASCTHTFGNEWRSLACAGDVLNTTFGDPHLLRGALRNVHQQVQFGKQASHRLELG